MKFTNAMAAAAAVTAAGSIGLTIGAGIAWADPATQPFGSQGKLVDGAGNVVQDWTVSNLKPSSDAIPYHVNGTLWEATATDEAVQGGATPIVSNLNARSRDGETYRVLFGVATPQGVNPATLAQGQKTTGKVYFDVTGEAPDSVVYNAGGQDVLIWVGAPTGGQGGAGWKPGTGGASSASTATAPGATPVTPAADGTLAPGAAAAGAPGAVPATGSAGTPLPAGSAGTPATVPAGSAGTPLPAGEGTPVPASVGSPAAGTPAAGAPAAGAPSAAGAPAVAGAPGAAQAPAAGAPAASAPAVAGAPAPEGSQGTPAAPAPAASQGGAAAPTSPTPVPPAPAG